MFSCSLAVHSFFNNEDVRKLFVYNERKLVLSLEPPSEFHEKLVFLYKAKPGVKLTADNLGEKFINYN